MKPTSGFIGLGRPRAPKFVGFQVSRKRVQGLGPFRVLGRALKRLSTGFALQMSFRLAGSRRCGAEPAPFRVPALLLKALPPGVGWPLGLPGTTFGEHLRAASLIHLEVHG